MGTRWCLWGSWIWRSRAGCRCRAPSWSPPRWWGRSSRSSHWRYKRLWWWPVTRGRLTTCCTSRCPGSRWYLEGTSGPSHSRTRTHSTWHSQSDKTKEMLFFFLVVNINILRIKFFLFLAVSSGCYLSTPSKTESESRPLRLGSTHTLSSSLTQ